ncbi:MAG: pyridoxamine 5'-phosphate oxidase family protein [Desulfobacterales bacterium]|nr:pyridoxamine 5'-phosphate oxidase family protein [Desulfobacterales bacterium]
MRDDIKTLIRNKQHCVLATAVDGLPYCSLMAYATEKDCTRFIMVTYRQTRKFQNISRNPQGSLLIDSRETDRPQALTIEGSGEEIIAEADRKPAAELLLLNVNHFKSYINQCPSRNQIICLSSRKAYPCNDSRISRTRWYLQPR